MSELIGDDEALPGDLPKVFLSYSRKDRERAQRIADVLRERDFGVFKDTDDILPTEEWRDRLQQLIEESDTIVFLLSPHSANSEVCTWEVEYASSLNKRIAPIVIDDVDAKDIPAALTKLNYIFCTDRDPFENAVDTLVSAINLDIGWIREHTRLNGLARRWQVAGRPNHLLLRGQDIADAETWRDNRPGEAPTVTKLQADFISESRRASARRQKLLVVGSLSVAVLTIGLAIFAWFQSMEANVQRTEAEKQRSTADVQRDVAAKNEQLAIANEKRAIATRDEAWRTQSKILTDWSQEAANGGDVTAATLLLLAASPDTTAQSYREDALRPLLPEVRQKLFEYHFQNREITTLDTEDNETGGYRHAVFDPESERVLTYSIDGSIRIFDAQTGEQLINVKTGAKRVLSVAFSPDGKHFVAGLSDKTAWVWDAKTGRQVFRLIGQNDGVEIIQYSASGKYIVSLGVNVAIWNASTGRLVSIIEAHNHTITGAEFSADEKSLLSWSFDGKTVVQTNIENGENRLLYKGVSTVRVFVSPDRTRAVISDSGDSLIDDGSPSNTQLWNLISGQLVSVLSNDESLTSVAFTPDSKIVAAPIGQSIRLWDGKTGKSLPRTDGVVGNRDIFIENETVLHELEFSSDGLVLAASDLEGIIKIWSFNQPFKFETMQIAKPPEWDTSRDIQFSLSPDAAKMVTIGEDNVTTIWSIRSMKHLQKLSQFEANNEQPLFRPTDLFRLGNYFEKRAIQKDAGNEWPNRRDSRSITVSQSPGSPPDSPEPLAVTWKVNADTQVVVSGQKFKATISVLKGHILPITSTAFKSGSDFLATVSGDSLRVWNARNGEQIGFVDAQMISGLEYRHRTVFYSEDNSMLILVSEDFIDVFEADSLKKIASFVSEDVFRYSDAPPEYFESSEGSFVSMLEAELNIWQSPFTRDALSPRFWRIIDDFQMLVDLEMRSIVRCMTQDKLKVYFLSLDPPRWCVTGPGLEEETDPAKWRPKRPYHTAAWQQWQVSKDLGAPIPYPVAPQYN